MYFLVQAIGYSPTLSVKLFSYRAEYDSKFSMQTEKTEGPQICSTGIRTAN